METFVTADQHFNHKNIIKYCDRPFDNIGEMHIELVKRWNEVITPKDMIYVLGDFSFSTVKNTERFISQLNGFIIFIKGGHDHWIKNNTKEKLNNPMANFEKNLCEIKKDDFFFVLCHYPIEEWNRKHYGSIHLHGHSHGNLKNKIENRFDVGVDTNNFYPYNIKDFMK